MGVNKLSPRIIVNHKEKGQLIKQIYELGLVVPTNDLGLPTERKKKKNRKNKSPPKALPNIDSTLNVTDELKSKSQLNKRNSQT